MLRGDTTAFGGRSRQQCCVAKAPSEGCGFYDVDEVRVSAELPARFCLKFASEERTLFSTAFADFWATPTDNAAFESALQELHSEMTPAERLEWAAMVSREIQATMTFEPPRELGPAALRKYLCTLGTEVQTVFSKYDSSSSDATDSLASQETHQAGSFEFEHVLLNLRECRIPPGCECILAHLMALGFQMHLEATLWDRLELPVVERGRLLQGLTDSWRLTSVLEDSKRTLHKKVDHVQFSGNAKTSPILDNNTQQFKASCSALTVSTDIAELCLHDVFYHNEDDEARYENWTWLVYALFSKDSKLSVTRLKITDEMVDDHEMTCIESILEAS